MQKALRAIYLDNRLGGGGGRQGPLPGAVVPFMILCSDPAVHEPDIPGAGLAYRIVGQIQKHRLGHPQLEYQSSS